MVSISITSVGRVQGLVHGPEIPADRERYDWGIGQGWEANGDDVAGAAPAAKLHHKLEAAQVASFPEYWWIVHEVVRQGGDVDIDLGSGITPLHVAMRYRLYSLAQSMLENGAWPNAREYSGSTPLTYALVTSNECMVMLSRCLVDENGKGRDSKKHTMDGMFLLDEWARISTTANGLLASRRLLDVSERPKGEPLSSVVVLQRDVRQAVNEWNTAFMKLMLQEGGEWDALDASTNLHRSAVYGNAGGVDLLLANNVDPFVLDPLHRLP
eukprot:CAMPEP_0185783766 /NCGR_PEP_ID=MMETSP1174-20130828/118894_1 /TAXON_ID=35687 /ORGANISM="Dictyocha speculum, Strain CCMP1381" /LENGTH=268 /DNA_ID=CAMNT_0028474969 /DNA_START=93 /DNA_END=896 /DNA_ORIENTATION=-